MEKFEIRGNTLVRNEYVCTCESGTSVYKRTAVITKEEFIACYKAWIESEEK